MSNIQALPGRDYKPAQSRSQSSRAFELTASLFLPVWSSKKRIRSCWLNALKKDVNLSFEQPRKVRLLVDGDAFGRDSIRDAITYLAKRFSHVSTVIYAAPGVIKNKGLSELLHLFDASFVPIPCSKNQAAEPNDDAIVSEIRKHAGSQQSECIALLTADKGFASVLADVICDAQSSFVLIPSGRTSAINFYKRQGIPALILPSEKKSTKIRAILHADGSGTVEFGAAFDSVSARAQAEATYDSLEKFLAGQGCFASLSSSGGCLRYPIQRISKFWFANSMGPLTVFPTPFAVEALDHVVRRESRQWESNTQGFAFILPTRPTKVTKSQIETYGSKLACTIFRGGGPFMLQDSGDLVAEALRKLGYCFWNSTLNKKQLRKLGVLLDTCETTCGAAAKLKAALLSDSCGGQWQPGGKSTPTVVEILRSKNLLPRLSEVPATEDVWSAMMTFAQVHRLPKFKTFNALAACIIQQEVIQKDPHRRGNVVIGRWCRDFSTMNWHLLIIAPLDVPCCRIALLRAILLRMWFFRIFQQSSVKKGLIDTGCCIQRLSTGSCAKCWGYCIAISVYTADAYHFFGVNLPCPNFCWQYVGCMVSKY